MLECIATSLSMAKVSTQPFLSYVMLRKEVCYFLSEPLKKGFIQTHEKLSQWILFGSMFAYFLGYHMSGWLLCYTQYGKSGKQLVAFYKQ